MNSIKVVDSHTGGEPTRVVVNGAPDLGEDTLQERLRLLREQHDDFRGRILAEPRGSDILVGALLCEPQDPRNLAGIIFFNNVGYLGMCGHGTIGAAVTLAHQGLIEPGQHTFETPVGNVPFTLHDTHQVTVNNVPCYRYKKNVAVTLRNHHVIYGDIAWGGNWFFLIENHGQSLNIKHANHLIDFCAEIKQQLSNQGITGKNGAEIDHIELFSPPSDSDKADSKNFVLCPGMSYDRSPCGTGTSAKLACLHEDGKLKPGELWRQESFIGSVFEGTLAVDGNRQKLLPKITGHAYIIGETTLLFDDSDAFKYGIAP